MLNHMGQTFQKGYAVVIGVGADLPVTVDDADVMAKQLTNTDYCAYPDKQVHLLTGNNADRTSVLSSLKWLSKVTTKDDTVVIYYSGHGIETPDYYLMPYGYNLADLSGTAIAGKIFTEHLRSIQAAKLLVILDCCHAGGQAEAKGVVKSPLPESVMEELGTGRGRVVLASSRKDEVSWTGKPYSVFTASLLEGLAGAGAFEHDGYARVLDMALWVGRKVPERTKDRQHPIIKVSSLEDNFAVAFYAAGKKQPHPLPELTDAVSQAVTTKPGSAQAASWKRMLSNYRENLLLIEERMSEYVNFVDIPIQLIKTKRQTEEKISELEQKLMEHTHKLGS